MDIVTILWTFPLITKGCKWIRSSDFSIYLQWILHRYLNRCFSFPQPNDSKPYSNPYSKPYNKLINISNRKKYLFIQINFIYNFKLFLISFFYATSMSNLLSLHNKYKVYKQNISSHNRFIVNN